jgi:prepilin-type N-terminal cleavage/methylation domain-containing protein
MKILRFRSCSKGFTLLEILIVVAILGILVGLAMPNFLKSRYRARQQMCIENLSQIESAKQIWGVENAKKDGDVPPPDQLVGPTLYMKKQPLCAGGGVYEFNAIGVNATCSLGSTDGHSL